MKKLHILVLNICSAVCLSACAQIPALEATATLETEEVVTVDEVTAQPEQAPLFYSWDISKSTIISVPIEITTAGIAACIERGYDTGFVVNLSISGHMAEAEFGCRGSD